MCSFGLGMHQLKRKDYSFVFFSDVVRQVCVCVCVCVWSNEGESDRMCTCEGVAGGIICRYGDQQVSYHSYGMCHVRRTQASVRKSKTCSILLRVTRPEEKERIVLI